MADNEIPKIQFADVDDAKVNAVLKQIEKVLLVIIKDINTLKGGN